MIKLSNVSRYYDDFLAVDDVSFEIPKGQIVGLLGHNGAGKTTIMKILTGFLEASSGKIEIDNLNIEDHLIEIQSKIGYLPENVPLYPEMTVLDYLEYVADLRGLQNKEQVVSTAVQKTALKEKASSKIETLSKGYKQRVGVAQAILHSPEILILDEPTNGLDPTQIQDMRNLIIELGQESTVILSTHIMQEVEAVCERVLILQRGKLSLDASLAEIKSSGSVVLSLDQEQKTVLTFFEQQSVIRECSFIGRQDNVFSYSLIPSSDVKSNFLPKLAEQIVSKGWKLYALSPREQSLEGVFRSVSFAAVRE